MPNASVDLSGKLAVVTGASSGIGRAVALALARQGMALHLIGRDEKRLAEAGAEARNHAREVTWTSLDLTRLDSVAAWSRTLASNEIAVLFHAAGLYARGRHDERQPGAYAELFAANVSAPMHLTQCLLPRLRTGQGQIVFMNSTQGLAATATVGLYAATHHAMRAMADSLRDEVNADGIRVLSVYAGRTATPRQASIFALEGRPYTPEILMQAEDVATMVVATLTLPRSAEVTNLTIRPMRKA